MVTSDTVTLALKDGKKVDIPANSVTSLSYGQEAHRRVGTMVALAVLVAPVALFGLFHKTRLHYIGIQYKTPEGKSAGILLQGHKDNYRAMLVALQGVTGVPVSVAEKEREFIPVGVKTDVTKGESEGKAAESKPVQSLSTKGAVNVSSNPAGADVLVDGEFVGNCPAALKLTPGKHTIAVKMSGYKDWSREITGAIRVGSAAEREFGKPKLTIPIGSNHLGIAGHNMSTTEAIFELLAEKGILRGEVTESIKELQSETPLQFPWLH